MFICVCTIKIEYLRMNMESKFTQHNSFSAQAVLSASQNLDDALINFWKCPGNKKCCAVIGKNCSLLNTDVG